jgi:hypothetical protein
MNLLKRIKRFNQKLCYGCSYTPDFNFFNCCKEHDDAYDKGGTEEDKKKADNQLRECIKQQGHPHKANLYYMGVKVFGRFFFRYK